MADILRIKRRVSGSPGAPTSLANAELAYNEVDHILYYGEGTGGAGGTASVVVGIGGNGLGSNTNPIMNGAVAPGVGTLWSRNDHVHPVDTSRAPLASPAFTGTPTVVGAPPAGGTNTTQIATTAFVTTNYAPLASPAFTGTPTVVGAPPASGTSTTPIATTAFVLSTRIDQLVISAADVSFNSHKITSLLDPTNPQDAATKNYVDGAIQGIEAKQSARAATTANVALTGLQTIDGISLIANDRVLVKNQTLPVENGIYVVASGAWARAADANTWTELISAYVFVEQGVVNADSGFLCTVDAGGAIGSTAVTWVQFSGAGSVVAGAGLTKTGSQIDVIGTSARILVNADNIDIDAAYVGQASITTLGTIATGTWNATTIAVNRGGSGAVTLSGYLFGNGTSAFTASATIPNTAISGLGTMSTQNANAVVITGGTIDGVTFDMGTF